MTDFKTLEDFIDAEGLFTAKDKLLLALSGGIDSMVLLSFLHEKGYTFEAAHCNFGLRDHESDVDALFIQNFCQKKSIPIHLKSFETKKYSKELGISTQMAARDLRFAWFEELINEHHFTKLLTAHHKTDHVETVLLNQVRGTGTKGLEGLHSLSGIKVKPLLCYTRGEIHNIMLAKNIQYREDSSNKSINYHRNRIRLRVLPNFEKINPSFEDTFIENSKIIKKNNSFVFQMIEKIKEDVLTIHHSHFNIDIKKLQQWPEPDFILYHILSEFDFNSSVIEEIFQASDKTSGKVFYSKTHRLSTHIEQFIIEPISEIKDEEFHITEHQSFLDIGHAELKFSTHSELTIVKDPSIGLLDFEKLKFPLKLRHWHEGDKIMPLGMTGHKKLSDIFIDRKLSLREKENIWVLESENQIAWIPGLILSEEYKIQEDSKKVYKIIFKAKN